VLVSAAADGWPAKDNNADDSIFVAVVATVVDVLIGIGGSGSKMPVVVVIVVVALSTFASAAEFSAAAAAAVVGLLTMNSSAL
jgi:hypothetical protein